MTSSDPGPVLELDAVGMRFGGLVAVDELSFAAERGHITALIGPNGAGKTTVFNCITGFYRPTSGSIRVRHADGASYPLHTMAGHRICEDANVARTFQNIRLFAGMSLLENLLVAQHNKLMRASGFTVGGLLGLPSYARAERAAVDKARGWLERIELLDRADDPAGSLPYGDQRRLEIARAMCTDPVLLCLDEPAAGLNPRESAAPDIAAVYAQYPHIGAVLPAMGYSEAHLAALRAMPVLRIVRPADANEAAWAWRDALPESTEPLRLELQILTALNQLQDGAEPLAALLSLTPEGERGGLIAALPRFFERAADKKRTAELLDSTLPALTRDDASPLGFSPGNETVGSQTAVYFVNTAAGPVTPTVTAPPGYTCTVFPGDEAGITMASYGEDLSAVSIQCHVIA